MIEKPKPSEDIVVPTRNSRNSAETIEIGLRAMALCHGNSRKARKLLDEQGLIKGVNDRTLHSWMRDLYPDRYAVLAHEEMQGVYDRIATTQEGMVSDLLEVQEKAVEKLKAAVDDDKISAREMAAITKDTALSMAINQDKASLIRGRPTEIRQERSVTELMDFLHRTGMLKNADKIIEGTAVEE